MSDQDNDIFAGNDQLPEVAFEDLVGEDKRYKDQTAIAKAVVEKDRYIKQLEREQAEAREAINKRINEEEFLKKLEEFSRKSPEPQDPPVEGDAPRESSALTPEKLDEKLNTLLETRERETKRKRNLEVVAEKMQEVFGDDYKSRVQSQARQLGVGTGYLTSVASDSPEAFFRLMGIEQRPSVHQDVPPPRSSVAVTNSNAGKKDYNYYRKLRQEKGDNWYFSLPVQQEIWEAAKAAESRGEKFLP